MEKHPTFEKQTLKNIAAVIPYIPPSLGYLLKDVQIATTMQVAQQKILPFYRASKLSKSWYQAQQSQSMLQPIHSIIGDFWKSAMSAPTITSIHSELAKSLLPNISLDLGRHLKDINSIASSLEILPAPAQIFPLFKTANLFPTIQSFLFDLNWLTTVIDHMNILTTSIRGMQSLNLNSLKEIIKYRLITAFKRLGLCFAPSMSEDLMYRIVDLLETNGSRSSITLLIWNYYARNNHALLRYTVERWQNNPEYARRWSSILLPAFQAHARGDYGLSISALAPLVEGIASHAVQKNMLLPVQRPRRGQLGLGSTKSVIIRTLRIVGNEVNVDRDTIDITHWVRLKSALAFVEDIFCEELEFERDYDYIHEKDREVHRHGLLHGIQISAMTAFNSLRLFLLLDTMHYLLHIYMMKGGTI